MKAMLICTAALALLAGPVSAQNGAMEVPPAEQPPTGSLNATDAAFAKDAARSGQFEVELGQLISQQAEHPELKRLGQTLVQDHQRANEQLSRIAANKGLQLPQRPNEEERKELQNLRQLSGQEFDRTVRNHVIQHHRDDIAKFSRATETCQDAELLQFAQQTLPVLRQHLQSAEAIDLRGGAVRR